MSFRAWLVGWLLRPELEKAIAEELAKYDVEELRKAVNRLSNEKRHLVNEVRKLRSVVAQYRKRGGP